MSNQANSFNEILCAAIYDDLKNKMNSCQGILGKAYKDAEKIARHLDPSPYDAYQCQKGCYYCCTMPVYLFAYELYNIHLYMQQNSIDVTSKTNRLISSFDTKSDRAWGASGETCPFLDETEKYCKIYDVRPASCRAMISPRRDICIEAYNVSAYHNLPIMISEEQDTAFREGIERAILDAECKLGLASNGIELVSALHLLQGDGAVFDKWLNKTDPFSSARASHS